MWLVNAAIEGYQDQLLSIRQDVPGLVANVSEEQFAWSPDPKRWSMAQCFDHLNAAARAFVPAIDAGIEDGRARGLTGSGPFGYSLFERLFLRLTEPPPGLRFPAPRVFLPAPGKPMTVILSEFMDWQNRLDERLRQADGLDLRRARSRSPAFPLFAWSLGALFAITLSHERRHLWQARQMRAALDAGL
jgi:DinB family protein